MKSFFQRIHENHSGTRKTTSDDPNPTHQLWLPPSGSREDKSHQRVLKQHREAKTGAHKGNEGQASNYGIRRPEGLQQPHVGHADYRYATIPSASRKAPTIDHRRTQIAPTSSAPPHPHSSVRQDLSNRYPQNYARENQKGRNAVGSNEPLKKKASDPSLRYATISRTDGKSLPDGGYAGKRDDFRSKGMAAGERSRVKGRDVLPNEIAQAQSHRYKEHEREQANESEDREKGMRDQHRDKYRDGTREKERGRHKFEKSETERPRERERESNRYRLEERENQRHRKDRERERDGERENKDRERERSRIREGAREVGERERGRDERRRKASDGQRAMEYGYTGDGERERESDAERTGEQTFESRPRNIERKKDDLVQRDNARYRGHSNAGGEMQSHPRNLYSDARELERLGAVIKSQTPDHGGLQSNSHRKEDRDAVNKESQDKAQERRTRRESEGTKHTSRERERNNQGGSIKHVGHREHTERDGRCYKDSDNSLDDLRGLESNRQGSLMGSAAPHATMSQQAPRHKVQTSLPPHPVYQTGSTDATVPILSTYPLEKGSTSTVSQNIHAQTDVAIPGVLSSDNEGARRNDYRRRLRGEAPDRDTELSSRTPSANATVKSQTLKGVHATRKKSEKLTQGPFMQWLSTKESPDKLSTPAAVEFQTELPQDTGPTRTSAHASSQVVSTTKNSHVRDIAGQATFQAEPPTSRARNVEQNSAQDSLRNISLPQSSYPDPQPTPSTAQNYLQSRPRPVIEDLSIPEEPKSAVELRTIKQDDKTMTPDIGPSIPPAPQHAISPAPKYVLLPSLKARQPTVRMPPSQHGANSSGNAHLNMPEIVTGTRAVSLKDRALEPGQGSFFPHGTDKASHPAASTIGTQLASQDLTNPTPYQDQSNNVQFSVLRTPQPEKTLGNMPVGPARIYHHATTSEQVPLSARQTSYAKDEVEGLAPSAVISSQLQSTHAPPLTTQESQNSHLSTADLNMKARSYTRGFSEVQEIIVAPPIPAQASSHSTTTLNKIGMKSASHATEVRVHLSNMLDSSANTSQPERARPAVALTSADAQVVSSHIMDSSREEPRSWLSGKSSTKPEVAANGQSLRTLGPLFETASQVRVATEDSGITPTIRSLANTRELIMPEHGVSTTAKVIISDLRKPIDSTAPTTLATDGLPSHGHPTVNQKYQKAFISENAVRPQRTQKVGLTDDYIQSSYSLPPSYQTSRSTHLKETIDYLQRNDTKTAIETLGPSLASAPIDRRGSFSNPQATLNSAEHHQTSSLMMADVMLTSIQPQSEDPRPDRGVRPIPHEHDVPKIPTVAVTKDSSSHTQFLHLHQHPLPSEIQSYEDTQKGSRAVADSANPTLRHEQTKYNAPVTSTTSVEVHKQRLVTQAIPDTSRTIKLVHQVADYPNEPPKGPSLQPLPVTIDKQSQLRHNPPLLTIDGTNRLNQNNLNVLAPNADHETRAQELRTFSARDPDLRHPRPSTAMGFRQGNAEKGMPFSASAFGQLSAHAASNPKFTRQFSDDPNAKLASTIQRPSTAVGSRHQRHDKTYSLDYPPVAAPGALRQHLETLPASQQMNTSAIDHDAQSGNQVKATQYTKRTRSTSNTQEAEPMNRTTHKQESHYKISTHETTGGHLSPPVQETVDRPVFASAEVMLGSKSDHAESILASGDSRQISSKTFSNPLPTPSINATGNLVEEKYRTAKQSQITNSWHPRIKDSLSAANNNSLEKPRTNVFHDRRPSTQRHEDLDKPPRTTDYRGVLNQELQKRTEDELRTAEPRGYYPPIQHAKLAELLSSPLPLKDLAISNNTSAIPTHSAEISSSQTSSFNSFTKLDLNQVGKSHHSPTKPLHNVDFRGSTTDATHPKVTNSQEPLVPSSAVHTNLHIPYNGKSSGSNTESPSELPNTVEPQASYPSTPSLSQPAWNELKKISPKQQPLPVGTGPALQTTTSQPAPSTRKHLNVLIPLGRTLETIITPQTQPHPETSTQITAATYNSDSSTDMMSRQQVTDSIQDLAFGSSMAHKRPEKPARKPSEESVLATPSSIAPSMLKPTVSQTSIPVSLSSQKESRKLGLFSIFKPKTTQPSSYHREEDPSTEHRSRKESRTSTNDLKGKDQEREKVSSLSSRIKLPPPITIPVTTNPSTNRKSPNSKVFTPFRYLTTKRHRTVSAASMEAQDGTAPNTVVGSPTASIHSSQPPLQPPPLRDPFIATQEWRKQEVAEAREVSGGKLRRARPGVVFDVAEDPPEDRRRRTLRSKGPSRST